jgi:type VI secretion system Hcp family effector
MALNTYLTLKLDGSVVHGSVIRKGFEDTIEVHSLEWAFDSDGNVGEVKFVSEIDEALPVIATGLKTNKVADATFRFFMANPNGTESQSFTLHGTQGKVTSLDMWTPNTQDPNLTRYDHTVQYTIKFGSMLITWVPGNIHETIP